MAYRLTLPKQGTPASSYKALHPIPGGGGGVAFHKKERQTIHTFNNFPIISQSICGDRPPTSNAKNIFPSLHILSRLANSSFK